MNISLFIESLAILGQGMLGVFAVMAVIAAAIALLNKLTNGKK